MKYKTFKHYVKLRRLVRNRPRMTRKQAYIFVTMLLVAGIIVNLLAPIAQAEVQLRASNSGSVSNGIQFRNSSSNNTGTGATSISIAMPSGVVSGDVMVAAITVVGGTGVVFNSPPTGWTQIQRQDSGTALAQALFWKQAGANEAGPYAWSWPTTSRKASGVIMAYSNTATSSPIDVSNGQANASSATETAPAVTPTVNNDRLVGFYGEANSATYTATQHSNTYSFANFNASTGGNATTRTGTLGVDTQLSGGAGVTTGTKTATSGTTASVSIGQTVAIKPYSATSLALNAPTGVTTGDVLIAAITISSGIETITAPSGWTSVQSQATAGNEIKTQSWYKVAGSSEPTSYTWTWTNGIQASGVIAAYSGVDTNVSPVDVSGGQANTSSTSITAPSITTTVSTDLLIGIFGVANASAVTADSTMTSRDYSSATGTSSSTATRFADQQLSASGATGTRIATAGTAGVNVGQLIALKPVVATLSQGSHRWFSQSQQTPGVNWISRVNAANNALQSVTYGNGLYVAVSSDGFGNRVMTSPDGITWTSRTSAADNYWNSVTYGNGLYVAVASTGTGNRVMTSPDGITWTSRTSTADYAWNSVTYGNGLYVAVASSGTGNRVMTSPDGITWTSRTSTADIGWRSVTYGNGLFVAVSSDGVGNQVMTSPDGITWTSRTCIATTWFSVTYGNGLFVAVAFSGTNRVMTSPDGITWTSRTAVGNQWQSVTYGNGLFVAVANSGTGNRVITSPDGITWTSRTSAADNQWKSVTYGNGLFVAVSSDGTGNRVMTSDALMHATAATWTIRTSAADNQWNSVTYGNGLFVAVANSGTGNRVMTSPDGITWTSRTSAANSTWQSVTYGNGLFVAVAQSSTNNIMTSPDGITWTLRTGATLNNLYSVTYGNGLFVAVANSGTGDRVITSPDGITWTARTSASDDNWSSVTYGNGLFVAVANTSNTTNAMTSPDGITWTSRTIGTGTFFRSITAGNGIFVTVSQNGEVITSSDGITWTARTAASNNTWNSVAYGNGLFVAVAIDQGTNSSTLVMTSPDGITWSTRTPAASNDWRSVAYGNGLFVGVASSGTGNRAMTAPGIDADVGTPLATQDTVTANTTSDSVRLRMNVGVGGSNSWSAGNTSQPKLALQYATRTGSVCSASETFYDVGAGAGTAPWTSRSSAADNSWNSVTYGNGLFVAVASTGTGNRVMTSPDGITWTSRTSAADSSWMSVIYANGLFVAVGISSVPGEQVMTSPDGITWTAHAGGSASWQSVTYGNGQFVAVANFGNPPTTTPRVMTSPDGITWTNTTLRNQNFSSVAYGNGTFVSVNGTRTSTDGITWTNQTAPSNTWTDIIYDGGQFVAVASTGTGNRVMTSPNGATWTSGTSAADNSWSSVAYGNGLYVAVASTGTGNRVMTSTAVSIPVNWGGRAADNGGTVTANANDPTQGGSTIRRQFYLTSNGFMNQFDVATGEYGQFDFDLDMSNATYGSSYCLRIVTSGGAVLNSYSTYPEITRCTVPPLDLRMRHGAAFCAGSKRFMWSQSSS